MVPQGHQPKSKPEACALVLQDWIPSQNLVSFDCSHNDIEGRIPDAVSTAEQLDYTSRVPLRSVTMTACRLPPCYVRMTCCAELCASCP